jgi:hypothetical protein
MRTGMKQGPREPRLISQEGGKTMEKEFNFTLEEAVKISLKSATWLEESDFGAATQAIMLAQTMDQMPDRRHQIAPILIGLLSNLGLLNNRKVGTEMTPAEALAVLVNG